MILVGMLTPGEREALEAVALFAPGNYRPLHNAPISKTKARRLAQLDLVDLRKGDLDGALLVRLSRLGQRVVAEIRRTDARTRKEGNG